MQLHSKKPKVVLVAGSPRGGTTISSMVLGQHPNIFATGSLSDFPDGGGIFDGTNICSCGESANSCSFWLQVRARYQRFEELPVPKKTPHLFRIITEASGREYVVDMTHNMAYAEQLLGVPEIDLYLVHVIRDGRGVVYSRIRKDYRAGRLKKHGWRHLMRVVNISRHWQRHLRQFSNLEKQLGQKAIRISYEELCRNPTATLQPVGKCLGLNFDDIGERLSKRLPLVLAPHLIRGNPRLRLEKEVVLNYDDEHRRKMPLSDRMIFKIISRLSRS